MTNFNDLSKKPSQFLSLTGYTVEEFVALVPHFSLKFQKYMGNFTWRGKPRKNISWRGKPRKNREYVEYKNASLPTMENKLLFILIYLKGNDLQESLAERFGLSQPKANRWIHLLHEVLNQTLSDLEMLPARDAESLEQKIDIPQDEIATTNTSTDMANAEAALPGDTIAEVKTTETIALPGDTITEVETTDVITLPGDTITEVETTETITPTTDTAVETEEELVEINLYLHDGTERPINRPLDKELQQIFYSGKQKQHTVKNILLTDLGGYIFFLSDTFEGKKHDKKAADEAGYSLPENSYLGQDTGFQGFEIPGVNIIQPKKKPRGGELTKEEKERNRTISSVRTRIEHAIGGVKRYRILKDKLRNWKSGFEDFVMETCCGLHNFRLQFRPWNYETAVI